MPYTSEKPRLPETPDQLRERIPGWGVDKDPQSRPSVPRLRVEPGGTGAHWDFPARQEEKQPRERSLEHAFLTPVFGTAQPLRGISGALRRYAYERFSEARAAHWLLLLAADRMDVLESRVVAVAKGRPDKRVSESGVAAELTHHGLASRLARRRSDVAHHWMDPAVAAPWGVTGAGLAALAVAHRLRRATARD
jgi:hypothetical protein